MIALQVATFALAKKHQRGDIEEVDELAVGDIKGTQHCCSDCGT